MTRARENADGARLDAPLASPTFTGAVLGTPLSHRNMIINGGMQLAQRSTSVEDNSAQGSTIGYDTLDRWGYWAISANDFSVQQVTDSPTGFDYSLKVISTAGSTISAGYYAGIGQRIEANNVSQLCLNTSSAKTVTLSFWVKSSIAGTFGVYLWKGTNWNPSYTTTYTISSPNTWEEKTISVTFPTSGTFATTGTSWSFEVGFTLASGATFQNSSLNSWNAEAFKIGHSSLTNLLATNAATLQVAGVQLELGSTATPFEHRSYGDELAKCQRYYYVHIEGNTLGFATGYYHNTTDLGFYTNFPVSMRSAPTLDYVGNTDYFLMSSPSNDYFDAINVIEASVTGANHYCSPVSGTAGKAGRIRTAHASAKVAYQAEL